MPQTVVLKLFQFMDPYFFPGDGPMWTHLQSQTFADISHSLYSFVFLATVNEALRKSQGSLGSILSQVSLQTRAE